MANKKIAVYVRVSTGKQDADNQIKDLRAYADSKGYEIYGLYEDTASGSSTKRPQFNQMFEDAHKAKFNLVLFWALDRFSRRGTLYTLTKLKELEGLGIGWHSYREPYFSSLGQFKDVVLSIMATLAKIERQRISERTKAGLAMAKARGAPIGKRGKDKKPRSKKGYFK